MHRSHLISFISAVLLLLADRSTAQTYTECDPLKQQNCDPDKALGRTLSVDFTKGSSPDFQTVSAPDRVTYDADGAKFTVQSKGDNPTIQSNFYIMFGRVEATVQAAPGTGIVSSFVLQSDDLDEIDWEWCGGDAFHVQTNFFSKGNTETYNRGGMHDLYQPESMFHNYTVEWTDSQVAWYVDGAIVRTLEADNPQGYPQTPMALRIGSWAGGDPSNPPGTIEWAGGITDYSKGPFTYIVKSLLVEDYSTGTEYKYGDMSGSWTSIQAINGKVNGDSNGAEGVRDFASVSVSSAPTPTSTAIVSSASSVSSAPVSSVPVSSSAAPSSSSVPPSSSSEESSKTTSSTPVSSDKPSSSKITTSISTSNSSTAISSTTLLTSSSAQITSSASVLTALSVPSSATSSSSNDNKANSTSAIPEVSNAGESRIPCIVGILFSTIIFVGLI